MGIRMMMMCEIFLGERERIICEVKMRVFSKEQVWGMRGV